MTISLPTTDIAKKRSDFKKNLIQLQNPITYLAFRRPIEFVFPYVYFKTIKIDINRLWKDFPKKRSHFKNNVNSKTRTLFNVFYAENNHWGKFIQRPNLSFSYNE